MKTTIPGRGSLCLLILFLAMVFSAGCAGQVLKSIVYDFDGFDLNATTLPEGDYSYGDLTYQVVADPLPSSDMIGDRALKLNVNWNNGYAAFGRGISRFIEFDRNADFFNFYFYNPSSNNQSATIELTIADDDNQSNAYESVSDDSWRKSLTIPANAGWQLFSIPITDFNDVNAGGNGIFDVGFTPIKGMLLLVEFRFNKSTPVLPNAAFYIDMICFSEGTMPKGNSDLDLPQKDFLDYCPLGAHEPISGGNLQLIPVNVEGLFPPDPAKKLKYVNTYLQWSQNSSTFPNAFPGNSIQTLLNNGYRPIITWEPMYLALAPLDPAQPKLDQIINGNYNTFIDAFADKMVTYTDTVIIRFMHEFEGDWYPWCVSQNGQDPAKFALAFRKVVDRFRARGATKVKWMWCGNSDYAPYLSYNWMVLAYPGDTYVDYVATDIYNGHYPSALPWWRSFKWVTTESYYYLTKYFPNKPAIICELGCRERITGDDPSSQTKAQWYERMDKELQSNFRKVRGLIFFNTSTGTSQNWSMNSTSQALQSIQVNIWNDDYYFKIPFLPVSLTEFTDKSGSDFFPNPTSGNIKFTEAGDWSSVVVYDLTGKKIYQASIGARSSRTADLSFLRNGVYMLELRSDNLEGKSTRQKLLIQN